MWIWNADSYRVVKPVIGVYGSSLSRRIFLDTYLGICNYWLRKYCAVLFSPSEDSCMVEDEMAFALNCLFGGLAVVVCSHAGR